MNSRIREPLIWPPNRNDTSKLMSSDCSATPPAARTDLGGAFDEIAGRVDHEQPHPRALDLAAEQERYVEIDVLGLQRDAFGGVDRADRPADALRRLKHGRRVQQRFDVAGVRVFKPLGQGRQYRLADRQIAGAGDRHDALARYAEDMEFAKCRDVVETGIGPCVRDHDQAVPHQYSAAIGHSQSPNSSENIGMKLVANFRGSSNPNSPWRNILRMGRNDPSNPGRGGV